MAVEYDPAHSERTEGPTPSGGAYEIAYFMAADHSPCTRDEAVFIEVHEFDADGKNIMRTYLGPPGEPAVPDP